jgi:hypothetical protein
VFCLKYRCNMFDNEKNVVYCSWIPRNFAFEMQGEGKQLLTASCADENAEPCYTVFRPDRVRSKAQNALNRVRTSKIKKLFSIF